MSAVYAYNKQLQTIISQVQPDSIIVADNGLKGYLVPFLIGKNSPVIFECHGSKYVNERPFTFSFLSRLWFLIGVSVKKWGAKTFDAFVVLNRESAQEWNSKNSMIIANPLSFKSEEPALLDAKKVLAVSRNSYEKGLDRLLEIWSLVFQKYPDWKLDIYGTLSPEENLIPLANALGIASSVRFYPPVSEVATLYANASMLVMTSRSEGLGLVLLLGFGTGFGTRIEGIFGDAKSIVIFWPSNTTQLEYQGLGKGRTIKFTPGDIEAIRQSIPGIQTVDGKNLS